MSKAVRRVTSVEAKQAMRDRMAKERMASRQKWPAASRRSLASPGRGQPKRRSKK